MDNPLIAGSVSTQPSGLRRPAWHFIFVAVVLIAAALVVPLAALGNLLVLGLLAAPILVGGIVALIIWPTVGLPLAVITSLLVPISLGTGTQTGINASVLLACGLLGLWAFDVMVLRRPVRLIESPTVRPLLAMMVVSIVAFGFGQMNWLPARHASLSAQLGGLAVFLLSPAVFLLAASRIASPRSLQWALGLFCLLGGVFAFAMLFPTLRPLALASFARAVMDAMFWTWLATLAVSQSWLNRKLPMIARLGLAGVAIAAFYFTVVVRQSWTSGWLPALVSIAVIVAVTRPKWFVVGLLALMLLLVIRPEMLHGVLLGGDNEYSLQTRIEAWRILFDIIRLNPLLGIGPSNYYSYTALFSILGYSVNFNSHNNYIDIVAQIGLVGLGCFGWFAWELGRTIWRSLRRLPEGFERAYMTGALGGLVGMLVAGMLGDWFLPFVYNVGLEGFRASGLAWMFLGAAVALEHTSRQALASPVAVSATPVGDHNLSPNMADESDVSVVGRASRHPG